MLDNPEPIYISVESACRIFGCGRAHLYELLGDGQIVAIKNGRRTLIQLATARRYFESLPPARIKPSTRSRKRAAAGSGPEAA